MKFIEQVLYLFYEFHVHFSWLILLWCMFYVALFLEKSFFSENYYFDSKFFLYFWSSARENSRKLFIKRFNYYNFLKRLHRVHKFLVWVFLKISHVWKILFGKGTPDKIFQMTLCLKYFNKMDITFLWMSLQV